MTWLINCLIGLCTKKINRKPNFKYTGDLFKKILWVCDNRTKTNHDIDFKYEDITKEMLVEALEPVLKYIDNKHDCADFRVLQLIKFKYVASEFLTKYPELEQQIKHTLLNFKFWILSPGNDSMCYYSENHQICFIACEYLIGKFYPEDIFSIDNKQGKEHMKYAEERFNYWIELRKKYSYSEFYSSNYMPVNLNALGFIILYSENKNMIAKSTEEMDTILSFYATNLFENSLSLASGRDYSRNVMNCSFEEPNSEIVIDAVFGSGEFAINQYYNTTYMFASFYLNNNVYKLKDSIRNLAFKKEFETKRKFGLDLKDYKKEGLLNNSTKSIMMRLGSGALTNPEIIDLTVSMMEKNKNLFHSDFLHWMRFFYSPLLHVFKLNNIPSKTLNFYNNRMAIEENNVYTYRNEYYRLSASMNYKPGTFGAQRNTIVATLPNRISVYTTHPLVDMTRKNYNFNGTPSYFGGYAVAPCSYANKNVGLVIYNIPKIKPFLMPYKILDFTHAFFPTELFDECEVSGNYAFARVKDSYIVLIGKNALSLRMPNEAIIKTTQGLLKDMNKSFDLIQKGKHTYWIYELSSKNEETFEEFKQRIKSNKINFENNTLEYQSKVSYKAEYKGKFYINNEEVDTNYDYDLGGKYE